MSGVARAMKRHGITAKPFLSLVNTVRSGDSDFYMFDLSGFGKHYLIKKEDFWRGGGTSPYPPEAPAEAEALEEAGLSTEGDVVDLEKFTDALPAPTPAQPEAVEYIQVNELSIGDVINLPTSPLGQRREIIRVVPNGRTSTVHYVYEGTAALHSAKYPPGKKLVLRKRNTL